ncbi:hypothetical protein BC829DRAFT_404345 [Chytridium lagenaria]|nr:hypothetical protein BC829DRAFT_404345 [Chytridium lagenaria]
MHLLKTLPLLSVLALPINAAFTAGGFTFTGVPQVDSTVLVTITGELAASSYVALGINDEAKMQGADMFVVRRNEAEEVTVDHFLAATEGRALTAVTSEAVVLPEASTFNNGVITLTFRIPTTLTSTSRNVITANSYLWAVGATSSTGAPTRHTNRGIAQGELVDGAAAELPGTVGVSTTAAATATRPVTTGAAATTTKPVVATTTTKTGGAAVAVGGVGAVVMAIVGLFAY